MMTIDALLGVGMAPVNGEKNAGPTWNSETFEITIKTVCTWFLLLVNDYSPII